MELRYLSYFKTVAEKQSFTPSRRKALLSLLEYGTELSSPLVENCKQFARLH